MDFIIGMEHDGLVLLEMPTNDHWWENAIAERFFKSLKTKPFPLLELVKQSIKIWCNKKDATVP